MPLAILPAQAQSPQPKVLHIAAASDLQPVLPTLAAAYEHATGVKIIASFGSSATLTEQIENGAPQDLFLSADFVHPEKLIADHLADGKSPTPYAHGILVLWARKDSPAQPITLNSLRDPKVTKIAIANQFHAPYGMAAARALENLKLTAIITPKLVVGENISQTAQFAESGNAQLGLISLTIASSPHYRDLGTFVRIPSTTYPPIIQCGVVLKSSKDPAAAHAFLDWLTSKPIQPNLRQYGLDPVP
ncbi:MAG: molybdate ABC transporter substrate-binding protein [Acidobacteriota bacterium]